MIYREATENQAILLTSVKKKYNHVTLRSAEAVFFTKLKALPYKNRGRLYCRERGILSRKDLIQLDGTVTKVLGGGSMEIKCDNDVTVRGVLSGRMKKHRIKVMVGDRIQVSVSPYDTTHGLITYRY